MTMNWKTWCSLCASIDTKQIESDTPIKIISAIYKHFNVIHQGEQLKICVECREFLDTFVLFQEKCRKVQLIFRKISSNPLINSKRLYDMRIDAGLDSDGIKIEVEDEIMRSWENNESPSCESHFIKETDDDVLSCSLEHVESENEQTETAVIEQNTPDDATPIRKLRTRTNTDTAATKPIKIERKGRISSITLAKNKQIKCKTTQQHNDFNDTQMVDQCPKKFTNSSNAAIHFQTVHGDGDGDGDGERIICDRCSKPCNSISALNVHLVSHSDERPFKCNFENCEKSYKSKPSLKKHKETHLEKRICDICGLGLSSRAQLLRHMVVHQTNCERFECTFCSKKFKRSKALKIHLILHTGLRPYSCPFCSYTCANGANFRSHKKKFHPDELAKLEASGETLPKVVMPKLKELQSMNNGEQNSNSH